MKPFTDVKIDNLSADAISAGKTFISELALAFPMLPLNQEGTDVLRLRAREAIDELVKDTVNKFLADRG